MCGYIAAPAAGSIQAEPIQDAEPNPEADKLFNVNELVLDEFMVRLQKRFINEIQDASLEDPVFALEDTVFKKWADLAMLDSQCWSDFIRSGFFNHDLLRPILDNKLRELTILSDQGNESARAALVIAHGHMRVPAAAQLQTANLEDDDPPDGRPPDLDDSAHDAFVATMPQVCLSEATLAAFKAALSASQYTAPQGQNYLCLNESLRMPCSRILNLDEYMPLSRMLTAPEVPLLQPSPRLSIKPIYRLKTQNRMLYNFS